MDVQEIFELKKFANDIRRETLKEIQHLGVGHLGGSLSVADVLAVLYGKQMHVRPEDPKWPERDYLVMSKGHAGPAVYAALALKGYFPKEMLMTLNQPGTSLPSHCDMNRTPGIDMTTGSLGQGASSAMGIALGNRMKGIQNYTYLILGDGEIEEGQVWEAALFAGHRKLSNLIAFVDYNKLQIDGSVEEVGGIRRVSDKFEAFDWFVQEVDGHSVEEISDAVDKAKAQHEKPSMIVLHTVKGKGFKEVENTAACHSMNLSAEQLERALHDLDEDLENARKEAAQP